MDFLSLIYDKTYFCKNIYFSVVMGKFCPLLYGIIYMGGNKASMDCFAYLKNLCLKG